QFGLMMPEEIAQLGAWWDEIAADLAGLPGEAQDALIECAWSWVHPHNHGNPVSDETRKAAKAVAECILRRLAELATRHPGRLRRLRDLIRLTDIDLPLILDSEFEALCPGFPDRD